MSDTKPPAGLLRIIGPGLLVAATGVGAGDLATASFAGNKLGVAILWAVIVGAFLKFVLNEGLARYQLATGQTLLEGAVTKLGGAVRLIFLVYLLFWTFWLSAALAGACGVTMHAMIPIFDEAPKGKLWFGTLHSVAGVILVRAGGFKLFEKIMSVCIAVMFVTVIVTAVLHGADWAAVGRGLVVPTIPQMDTGGLSWTVALLGGIGGTLTVLCYGYWIREQGRDSADTLSICRIDLGVGYAATAVFGLAMVIIGSGLTLPDKQGSGLVVALAMELNKTLGPAAMWVFLIGAWGAVFSSLLGCWQAVPYLFADFYDLSRRVARSEAARPSDWRVDVNAGPYRGYLAGMALVAIVGLLFDFKAIAKYYAIVGALFMPLLALVLLILNGRARYVGKNFRNRWPTVIVLIATLVFFAWAGWLEVTAAWGK